MLFAYNVNIVNYEIDVLQNTHQRENQQYWHWYRAQDIKLNFANGQTEDSIDLPHQTDHFFLISKYFHKQQYLHEYTTSIISTLFLSHFFLLKWPGHAGTVNPWEYVILSALHPILVRKKSKKISNLQFSFIKSIMCHHLANARMFLNFGENSQWKNIRMKLEKFSI